MYLFLKQYHKISPGIFEMWCASFRAVNITGVIKNFLKISTILGLFNKNLNLNETAPILKMQY